MKNDEYWTKRALKREEESYAKGAELSMRLFKEYERAAREIRIKVNDFYARYADENGLSFGDAVKLLNRPEKQEWKASIGTWVNRINQEPDEAVKALLKAELDALSYNSQISRLEALYGQIQMILNGLFTLGVKQMKEEFGDMFEEGYYKKVFDIQQRVGFVNEFAKINEGMINNIVSYPWSGADFSQRLWENKKVLHFQVRETITQGLIQGKSVSNMSKSLSDKMGSSYKNAERLIRTETTHFHNEATKTAYNAAGVEQYEYMATLDHRTSDACRGLDGKHFKLSDAKAGVNFPPMHPNCRSTTIEYDPDDELDWINSGQPMPENMTYEEWLKQSDIGLSDLKEQSQGKITKITDESIKRVSKVNIHGLNDFQNEIVQNQHKELLKYARDENNGHECAFILDNKFNKIANEKGMSDSLEFESKEGLDAIYSKYDLFIMHNHPRNKSYSLEDIRFFFSAPVKSLSIVKNNGHIEVLTKTDKFDKIEAVNLLKRKMKKTIKQGTDSEYDKVVKSWLNDINGVMIEWIKT